MECTGKSEKVTMPSSWMSEAMKVEKPMEKPSEKNIRVRGIERMGGGIKQCSGKAWLRKWQLSKDLKEGREGAMGIPGEECSTWRKRPVQRS